ncbi:MAG: hypothetical protein AAGA03_11340 [Planctomycetota bacterium]
MRWIDRLFGKRLTLNDIEFGQIEYDDGIWTATRVAERDFTVRIVADDRGPTRPQRQLFQRLLGSLNSFMREAECFLKQHPDIANEISDTKLGLHAVEIANPAEPGWGQFAIELADTDPLLADAVYGVRFHDDAPTTWYVDH